MIQLLLTVVAGLTGYLIARNFVRNRLRYVDAIHSRWAPLAAGTLAFVLASPLALLPLLSAVPAVVFGIGIALGTASGAKFVRRGDATRRRITP